MARCSEGPMSLTTRGENAQSLRYSGGLHRCLGLVQKFAQGRLALILRREITCPSDMHTVYEGQGRIAQISSHAEFMEPLSGSPGRQGEAGRMQWHFPTP